MPGAADEPEKMSEESRERRKVLGSVTSLTILLVRLDTSNLTGWGVSSGGWGGNKSHV